MAKRLCILTGEKSAENYAEELIRILKQSDPNLQIDSTGSDALVNAGSSRLIDLSPYSSIGFLEPIRNLPFFFNALRKLKAYFRSAKPDLVLAIDNQGFNVQVLKAAKKLGIKTAYFIAPQEWQWGKKKNGIKLASIIDTIFSIFEEEHQFYADCGAKSIYVGHPLKQLLETTYSKSEKLNIQKDPNKHYVALLPGSRKQEMTVIAPELFRAAKMVQDQVENVIFYCSLTKESLRPTIEKMIQDNNLKNIILTNKANSSWLEQMDFSITKSGTSNLEHAILEIPCVTGYKLSPISQWVAGALIRKKWEAKYKYYSLPNIMTGEYIVEECYLENCNANCFAKKTIHYLQNPKELTAYKKRLADFNTKLSKDNSLNLVAEGIFDILQA